LLSLEISDYASNNIDGDVAANAGEIAKDAGIDALLGAATGVTLKVFKALSGASKAAKAGKTAGSAIEMVVSFTPSNGSGEPG
jgi:hypothetical protein